MTEDTHIQPYSIGGEVVLARRYGLIMANSMNEAIEHVMANHGDECEYCRTRRARQDAAEARFRRHLARVKRLALTHPTERNLDAYAGLRIEAREYGYE